MRNFAIIVAAATAAFASPVFAQDSDGANGEVRVEGRTGILIGGGDSDFFGGIGAGYDYDFGKGGFMGIEASADKIFANNTRVTVGGSARLGVVTEGGGKLYVAGGYQTKPCATCGDAWSVGGGFQVPFGESLYGKMEYREFLANGGNPNYRGVAVGLGMRF
ncbi:hypothetical protein QWY75_02815 [Pontixanthobacter aestiaquae]|uniref:Outer membrane protein beta-barrel domain-containing protein n=1 Tax=Pontixanthobacter aestiaquae TaxID=1509367 RepID=A0A844Z8P1_9SPHN|nr:hypothetical protein [Pontixanthobacter aestiaquae]MDN3645136.1 hypothetical protein [Pontixanthobacter aestiaquae]MXO83864.1 hypothetical protein [Pontixanthobacter aestiaquae]